MRRHFRARLDAAIAIKNAERGRPLKAREKLENLERGLGYAPGTAPWWPRRDSDGTATAAINEDLSVPKDCQARAESIARSNRHD